MQCHGHFFQSYISLHNVLFMTHPTLGLTGRTVLPWVHLLHPRDSVSGLSFEGSQPHSGQTGRKKCELDEPEWTVGITWEEKDFLHDVECDSTHHSWHRFNHTSCQVESESFLPPPARCAFVFSFSLHSDRLLCFHFYLCFAFLVHSFTFLLSPQG